MLSKQAQTKEKKQGNKQEKGRDWCRGGRERKRKRTRKKKERRRKREEEEEEEGVKIKKYGRESDPTGGWVSSPPSSRVCLFVDVFVDSLPS